MKTAFALILALIVWDEAAQACTIIVPDLRPGETIEQAFDRVEVDSQRAAWRGADAVYVARVIEMSPGEGNTEYLLRPERPLRGVQPPRTIKELYAPAACKDDQFSLGDRVVVFAKRISYRDSLLRWGQWWPMKTVRVRAVRSSEALAAMRSTQRR